MSGLRSIIGAFLAASLLLTGLAQAEVILLGLGKVSGENYLFDIDLSTGRASNPRSTGRTELLVGISLSPEGTLYSLSTFGDQSDPNSLFTIDPLTGVTQVVGPTGLESIYEGDLDFDPTTGLLYGLQHGAGGLFTLNPHTGAATTVGSIADSGDVSAMAFDTAGTLYVLDTFNQLLLTVDPSDASMLTSVSLDTPIGLLAAGMDFHPETGLLYVTNDDADGISMLWTLDTTSGALTRIGPTGVGSGLRGLEFFPEPGTGLLLALGASLTLRRRRQNR